METQIIEKQFRKDVKNKVWYAKALRTGEIRRWNYSLLAEEGDRIAVHESDLADFIKMDYREIQRVEDIVLVKKEAESERRRK